MLHKFTDREPVLAHERLLRVEREAAGSFRLPMTDLPPT